MDQLQLFFIILGWLYLFYLHNRSLRRSEISRLKDRLIDKIEKLQPWYSEEIKNNSSPLSIEEYLASKITQIELRFIQLNHYLKCNLFSIEKLTSLRNIDPSKDVADEEKIREIYQISSDIIEHIESSYDTHLFGHIFFHRFWETRKNEAFGAITALIIIYLSFKILNLFFQ